MSIHNIKKYVPQRVPRKAAQKPASKRLLGPTKEAQEMREKFREAVKEEKEKVEEDIIIQQIWKIYLLLKVFFMTEVLQF